MPPFIEIYTILNSLAFSLEKKTWEALAMKQNF